MKTFTWAVVALAAVVATALAGCGGSAPANSPMPGVNPGTRTVIRPNIVPYLYVSDLGTGPGNGVVQVLKLSQQYAGVYLDRIQRAGRRVRGRVG